MLPSIFDPVLDANDLSELNQACGVEGTRGTLCKTVYNLTRSQDAAEIADAISKPVRVILIILAAYLINRLVRFFIRRAVKNLAKESSRARVTKFKKRTGLSRLETSENVTFRTVQRAQTIGTALRGVATFAIVVTAVLLILATYHIQLGPIFAGAGLIGIVVGFGAQSMIRDFLAGIFIIVEDWYGVGDVVDVGEAQGTVEQVTLRATRMRDVYGVVWHVPNGNIMRAGNKSQQWGRALLDIGVALDTDIELAQRVIKETADALANDPDFATEIIEEPDVLGVEEIGPDRIVIRVIIKTSPAAQWKVARELRVKVKQAFDENGIELPPAVMPGTYRDAMGSTPPQPS